MYSPYPLEWNIKSNTLFMSDHKQQQFHYVLTLEKEVREAQTANTWVLSQLGSHSRTQTFCTWWGSFQRPTVEKAMQNEKEAKRGIWQETVVPTEKPSTTLSGHHNELPSICSPCVIVLLYSRQCRLTNIKRWLQISYHLRHSQSYFLLSKGHFGILSYQATLYSILLSE